MALHLILDGYNVIGASQRYGSMRAGAPEMAREMLIDDLRRYKRNRGFRITVVFDGHHTSQSSRNFETYKGIRLIYTRAQERADDVIVGMVRGSSSGVIVVSSDREVAEQCYRLGASVISAGEFDERLERAFMTEIRGEIEEEGEDLRPGVSTKKRGPARRAGRRKRQDRKRLNKL